MSDLVFIRHGETDLAGTFCGHSDPPINARGQAQVAELTAKLSCHPCGPFDAIYSSDLQRAVETATPLATAFAVPLTITPALREIHFGNWEGLTWAQIEARDRDFAQRWIASFPTQAAPGGEPFAAFEHRILQEVERLTLLDSRKRLAIVTHGGVMRVVLQRLLEHTEEQAWELTRSYCSYFVYSCADASAGRASSVRIQTQENLNPATNQGEHR